MHPQFIKVQEQVAATGERFTLLPDGTVEDKTADGVTSVPGLKLDKNGVWRLSVGEEQVELKPADVSFDDDKGINVKGYTLDEANGLWGVERPIKEFPWCKDFSKFAEYPVAFADLQEQGRFVQSTLTADLFDPTKLNFAPMASMTVLRDVNGTILVPDVETAPNYEDEATAPFKKDFMCGITEIDDEKYRVIQVPYYVESVEPSDWPVMTGLRFLRSDYKGTWPIGSEYFMNRMNVVPWEIDEDSIAIATQFTNPKTGNNFTTAEVNKIIGEMRQGNFANTNGLVLKFDIARSSGHWYE